MKKYVLKRREISVWAKSDDFLVQFGSLNIAIIKFQAYFLVKLSTLEASMFGSICSVFEKEQGEHKKLEIERFCFLNFAILIKK